MTRLLVANAACALALASAAASAAAQAPVPDPTPVIDAKSAAHFRDAYLNDLDTLHAKVMALANTIPAEKYGWRPEAGVRSVSEALMHVASEWYLFTPMSVAAGPPADFIPATSTPAERRTAMQNKLKSLEQTTDKSAVLAELDRSWAHCRARLAAANPAALTGAYAPWGIPLDHAAFVMDGDLHEHLGQLIAYSRSVGVTPPWSK